MGRSLAHVEIIEKLEPIIGADKIELATILGWTVIVEKNAYKVGDKVIYCEIDSVLPEKEQFEFLRKRCFISNESVIGFRIKSMKMRGVLSQGIVFPMNLLPSKNFDLYKIGQDVTDILGIKLYENAEKVIVNQKPKKFMKRIYWEIKRLFPKKNDIKFPKFLIQTDELRIQNFPNSFKNHKNEMFYISEKLDGSPSSFAVNKGKYYVCSRNLIRNCSTIVKLFNWKKIFWKSDMLQDSDVWNKISEKYKLKERLSALKINVAIQGEIIGEGIQKNKYKLKGIDFYVFGVFDIDKQRYYNFKQMKDFIYRINLNINNENLLLKTVPIIDENFLLLENIQINDLIKMADGKSVLIDTSREGLVFRLKDDSKEMFNKVSFKAISNEFLLKYEE